MILKVKKYLSLFSLIHPPDDAFHCVKVCLTLSFFIHNSSLFAKNVNVFQGRRKGKFQSLCSFQWKPVESLPWTDNQIYHYDGSGKNSQTVASVALAFVNVTMILG